MSCWKKRDNTDGRRRRQRSWVQATGNTVSARPPMRDGEAQRTQKTCAQHEVEFEREERGRAKQKKNTHDAGLGLKSSCARRDAARGAARDAEQAGAKRAVHVVSRVKLRRRCWEPRFARFDGGVAVQARSRSRRRRRCVKLRIYSQYSIYSNTLAVQSLSSCITTNKRR
jgi:hypothetical protein